MNFYGITLTELENYFRERGENPAKAAITFDAVYRKSQDFSALPFSERVKKMLTSEFSLELPEVAERLDSEDTAKLLLRLADGSYAETVLMRQGFGSCICVSTQVGCSMGCAFCRSGRLRKKRSLTADEIVGQIISVQSEFGVKISGVSVMGIGEPFDNFDSTVRFLEIITAGKGLAIGESHITVSTCGLCPEIRRFAELPHPPNLAISLHGSNDGLRSQLMPINRKYPLAEVISAAEYFSERNNRRVTFEYIMLSGLNDTPENAQQLSDLIGRRNFYVNIIPYNPTDNDSFKKSSRERIMAFYDVLKKNKIGVTMRREFGTGLKAACGQLSSDHQSKETSYEKSIDKSAKN